MRILVANPNTTAEMTGRIGEAAQFAANAGTQIVARNPASGPAAIEGPEDGEAALPGLFALFDEQTRANDLGAAVVACFDDTGLAELKARYNMPVLGIGEASFHAAMMLGERFSVVTTLPVSIPVIEENIDRYGFGSRCARVRAAGITVLSLEHDRANAVASLEREMATAISEDGVDALVLGCAGMAGLADQMSSRFGVPVVEGVAAAVAFAEGLGTISSRRTSFPKGAERTPRPL